MASPLTFRVYVYSTGDGAIMEFDGVTLNGAVAAAPEPASLALLGMGGMLVLRRRER